MKKKACIHMLSSRTKTLPLCIKSLWDKWNYKYDYPVHVQYFDDIYDDEKYRQQIREFTKTNIIFTSVPYKTPEHVTESELFYNRKDLWYVNTGRFTPARKGYLHMSHYFNNIPKYFPQLFDYDYIMSIDDESEFTKEVPYNFFDVIEEREELTGAIKVTHAKDKRPHQGNFDCRVGMWQFCKDYIKKYNITPGSKFIRDLLEDDNAEVNFHEKSSADSYVFKTKLFKTPEWIQWNTELNASGGVHKYRWGDDELNYLFFLIHHDYPVYDFKTVDEGYHNQGGFRHIQSLAPSIKDFDR